MVEVQSLGPVREIDDCVHHFFTGDELGYGERLQRVGGTMKKEVQGGKARVGTEGEFQIMYNHTCNSNEYQRGMYQM